MWKNQNYNNPDFICDMLRNYWDTCSFVHWTLQFLGTHSRYLSCLDWTDIDTSILSQACIGGTYCTQGKEKKISIKIQVHLKRHLTFYPLISCLLAFNFLKLKQVFCTTNTNESHSAR